MGCFALAALLADARSDMNHTLYKNGHSPRSLPQTSSLFTVFCHGAGVVCLPDRAYIAAMFGARPWCELDFSSLCVMLQGQSQLEPMEGIECGLVFLERCPTGH